MPNFNSYKTTSAALFPPVGGKPSWKLNVSTNPWDSLVDIVALLFSWQFRAEAVTAITVGASPFIHTAGNDSEVIYIIGGTVSAVEKEDATPSWVSLGNIRQVWLAAGQRLRVSYSAAPTMRKDIVGAFNNAVGSVAPVALGASPATVTNNTGRNVQYFIGSDGAVTSVTRNGVSILDALPATILLPPGGAFVITYTAAPTVTADS